MMRKFWLSAALLAAAAILWAGAAIWKAARAARNAAAEVAASQVSSFTSRSLDRALPAVEAVGAPTAFTDVAQFAGNTFVLTPAALLQYDDGGTVRHRWRAGLELPPAPLAGLAVATVAGSNGPELWLATDGAGLVAFDGQGFRQILPADPAARKITALLPLATGRLLLGTAGHGVFSFDGKTLAPLDPTLGGLRVTALAGDSTSFWAGTADRGLYHWQAGALTHFGEPEGLPDANVTSIIVSGTSAFSGGPMGIAEFRDGRFYRALARGFFTSALALDGETLLAGSIEEGIAPIPLAPRVPRLVQSTSGQPNGAVERLVNVPGAILAVTSEGLYAAASGQTAWKPVTAPEPAKLADRNISALALDATGRLWVGYFDRGLDVLDGDRVSHFENDELYCINRIVDNPDTHSTAVATANGLVIFDNRPAERQVMRRAQGLIADDVTDIALHGRAMALATPAGITVIDDSGTHSVSDFHGLVNQHVYALAQDPAPDSDRLLAGTLGGLSVLESGVVRASYTTFNSRLKHNWITAIRRVGDDWFVGTYGAGVERLTRNGDWDAFPDLRGSIVINPNAMLVTPTRVYAGTMQNGLAIFERSAARWHFSADGLPSLNVTALAAGGGMIYIGTDNGLVRATEQNLR
jgi:ligand-binding sensor domain-containing protein